MEVPFKVLLTLLFGKRSRVTAEWTHEGDLIIGVFPREETYDRIWHGNMLKENSNA